MLLVKNDKLSPTDKQKLMVVYEESNRENAEHMFTEDSTEDAIKKVYEGFFQFLDEFLDDPLNSYYIWEEQGEYISTLRLTKLPDFYYMEALETTPDYRQRGYAKKLMDAVIALPKKEGKPIIRCSVSKKNEKSLAFHRKCGFIVDQLQAVQYYADPPVENPNAFGMLYMR